jgi:AcrR family transcriptional regulator
VPRIRLDLRVVIVSAMEVVDRNGFEGLSLSAVAHGLGVGPSALYSHVDGLDGLRALVASEVVRNAAIGTSGDDALRAVAEAYRGYAVEFPGRFTATSRVTSVDSEGGAAHEELDGVFRLVYLARGVSERAARAAGRNARGAIHGFLVLDRAGDDAQRADDDFAALLDFLCEIAAA